MYPELRLNSPGNRKLSMLKKLSTVQLSLAAQIRQFFAAGFERVDERVVPHRSRIAHRVSRVV